MGRKGLLLVAGILACVVLAVWKAARLEEPGTLARVEDAGAALERELQAALPNTSGGNEPRSLVQSTPELTPLVRPTHRISGRVLDERRRAVGGAEVRLGGLDEEQPRAISDASGAFELLVDLTGIWSQSRDVLLARDGLGRRAVLELYLPSPKQGELFEVSKQTLVLLPAHALAVQVRQAGAPVAAAKVRVLLGHQRLPAGEFRTDDQGRLQLVDLPPGPIHLTAELEQLAGRTRVFVPEERTAAIDLEPLYGVDVLVLDAESGAPIAGAQLDIRESYIVPASLPGEERARFGGEASTSREWAGSTPTTDESGRARVEGLAPGTHYRLSLTAEGYESLPGPGSGAQPLEAGGEALHLEMQPLAARDVRWPVAAGEAPVPPPNSPLRLRFQAGMYGRGKEPPLPRVASMQGSTLVAERVVGRGGFIAEAPDGSLARLFVEDGADLGTAIEFRKPRRIEVLVHDEAGGPLVGCMVGARNQGNNSLCELVPTDGQGLAVLEGLYGGLAEVSVLEPGMQSPYGPTYGSIDLEQGDGRLEVTLKARRQRRARLKIRIDSVSRLPARFRLTSRTGAELIEEFPTRGELLLDLTLEDASNRSDLWLRAVGFASAKATFEFVDVDLEPSVTLDLQRTAALIAAVAFPDKDYVSIFPQRYDEQQETWGRAPEIGLFSGLSFPNGPDNSFVFPGAHPGRWRVLDERSGVVSSAAELRPGDTEVRVELNLANSEWVSGRVELEDPAEGSRVRVLVEREAAEPSESWRPGSEPPKGAFLRDGEFRLRVPGDEEVTLVAWHPWLVPDSKTGRRTLRGGRDGVVLRLVSGDEMRLPLPQLGEGFSSLRIARFAAHSEPTGKPLEWHHAVFVGGVLRCSMPRGVWTLMLEPGRDYAPLVLREVEIEGLTELPAANFSRGSTLRIRVLSPPDSDTPRIYVFAEHAAAPAYHRSLNSSAESVVLIPGLGAGRYEVRLSAIMGRGSAVEQVIEVDGVKDFELEFDRR